MVAAHAYILNRKSAQWYLDRINPGSKALDVFLEWTPFDIYSPKFHNVYPKNTPNLIN